MPQATVFTGYDVVDNDHFAIGADAARQADANLRRQFRLPAKYFLGCARFVEKKNHFLLIDAYAHYRSAMASHAGGQSAASAWSLVLIGDGPLRAAVESKVAALGLQDHVQFRGAIGYAELPTYYGLAEAFLHPSKIEQWGLVVNEAMASGLPVLVSDRCGCVADLVAHGENGLLFDPSDLPGFSQCMTDISRDARQQSAMGRASRERMQQWGPERFAQGLSDAIACARVSGPPRRDRLGGMLLQLLAKCST